MYNLLKTWTYCWGLVMAGLFSAPIFLERSRRFETIFESQNLEINYHANNDDKVDFDNKL